MQTKEEMINETSSLEKGINVLDTDEDIQEFTIEQYECSKKAIIVALADQKAKIWIWLEQHKRVGCGHYEFTKKEFEEVE